MRLTPVGLLGVGRKKPIVQEIPDLLQGAVDGLVEPVLIAGIRDEFVRIQDEPRLERRREAVDRAELVPQPRQTLNGRVRVELRRVLSTK